MIQLNSYSEKVQLSPLIFNTALEHEYCNMRNETTGMLSGKGKLRPKKVDKNERECLQLVLWIPDTCYSLIERNFPQRGPATFFRLIRIVTVIVGGYEIRDC